MATSVHRLRHLCQAAAACGDLVAVARPDFKIAIYRGWQQVALLDGHEAAISGLQFCGGGGGVQPSAGITGTVEALRLVSSSHDRNSFVWTRGSSDADWRPELVITRLNNAGLCVAWSSCGQKYAIGGTEKVADVLYYAREKELWAPKLLRKQIESAVMAVTWHPSGALLATAGTDSTLRLFNALVPGVDDANTLPELGGSKFGDCLLEVTLPGGWGLAVAFSPDGSTLVAASQASQLTVIAGLDLQARGSFDAAASHHHVQHLPLPGLPLKSLVFLNDSLLVGGGFDCCPQIFTRQPDRQWQHAITLQGLKQGSNAASGSAATAPSLSARIKLFEKQAAAAGATGRSRPATVTSAAAAPGTHAASVVDDQQGSSGEDSSSGPHLNTIISIAPLPSTVPGSLAFLTASMEGCVAEWHVDPTTLR